MNKNEKTKMIENLKELIEKLANFHYYTQHEIKLSESDKNFGGRIYDLYSDLEEKIEENKW